MTLAIWMMAGAAFARYAPDDDADEAEMAQIKAALRQESRQRLAALRSEAEALAPPDPGSVLRAVYELLPDVSLVADLALRYVVPGAAVPIGGDAAQALGSAESLEIGLAKVFDPYFRLDAFAVAGNDGTAGLLEAYATTLRLPWRLQVRAGYLLHDFGLANRQHPHAYVFADRPLIVSRIFGSDGGKGLGVEASWLAPLPFYAEIAAAALDAYGGTTARSFGGDGTLAGASAVSGPPGPGDVAGDLLYVITVKQHHLLAAGLGLLVGLSAALGPNPTGRGNRTDVYGADVALGYGRPRGGLRLDLLSEWAVRRRQVPGQVLQDVTGYAELRVGAWSSRLALAARYQFGSGIAPATDPQKLDGPWVLDRHVIEAAVLLSPSRASRLRLQGSLDLGGAAPDANGVSLDQRLRFGAPPRGPGYGVLVGLQLFMGRHALSGLAP